MTEARVHIRRNDPTLARSQNVYMAKSNNEPDWFLRDWMRLKGKKQSHLVTELGWHKTAAHRLWHGRQPYRRDLVNEVAPWLEVQPFELLMSPREALALRQLRETAHLIVQQEEVLDPAAGAIPAARRGR
jgi:transcriptional regulator with XRE-family HTH domain